MKLGDFLNTQAAKLGLQNEKELIDILSKSEIANTDIPDSLANAMDNGLMTIDSAKNNFVLKNHFTGTTLNAVDAKLIEDLDLDEDTTMALQNERNSYNKIAIVKNALRAQIEQLKSGNPEDKSKKAEIERQIKELNDTISANKQNHSLAIKDLQDRHNTEITDFILTNHLASKNYANKDWDANDNIAFSKTLIHNALADRGIAVVRDGNNLKLKQSGAPELDYYENNKPISFSDFADSILASKKMIAINNSGENPNTTPQAKTIVNVGNNKDTSAFNTAVQQALSDVVEQ